MLELKAQVDVEQLQMREGKNAITAKGTIDATFLFFLFYYFSHNYHRKS